MIDAECVKGLQDLRRHGAYSVCEFECSCWATAWLTSSAVLEVANDAILQHPWNWHECPKRMDRSRSAHHMDWHGSSQKNAHAGEIWRIHPHISAMDPDKEAKRRKSIAYILRRRKRGRRIGANSGGPVKSVQRKIRGHVVFTPCGGASGWWRFSFILVAVMISIFPIFIFALAGSPKLHHVDDHSPLAPLFGVPIAVLMALICGFALVYTLVSIWRFIRARMPHKNE